MQLMDSHYLRAALSQAQINRGFCSPNPAVGAIIVKDHKVLATGFHLGPGKLHAEVDAINKLTPAETAGATIYISLEPCCHFGRTPPCTEALIQAGIKRVIYGYEDPNPVVKGKSQALLQAADIICDYLPMAEIEVFYQSYSHWHNTKRPFLTAKIALTLDGKIAGISGEPIAITGPALQAFTHQSRKQSDAILTTSETILKDDPRLNVRLDNESFAKPLYILDSRLRVSPRAKIFSTAQSVILFHSPEAPQEHQAILSAAGARCIAVEDGPGGLNLAQILGLIGQDGVQDLWVEAGGRSFTSFLQAGLLQKAYVYLAPKWLGEGVAAFPAALSFNAKQMRWQQYGDDVLCEFRW